MPVAVPWVFLVDKFEFKNSYTKKPVSIWNLLYFPLSSYTHLAFIYIHTHTTRQGPHRKNAHMHAPPQAFHYQPQTGTSCICKIEDLDALRNHCQDLPDRLMARVKIDVKTRPNREATDGFKDAVQIY